MEEPKLSEDFDRLVSNYIGSVSDDDKYHATNKKKGRKKEPLVIDEEDADESEFVAAEEGEDTNDADVDVVELAEKVTEKVFMGE